MCKHLFYNTAVEVQDGGHGENVDADKHAPHEQFVIKCRGEVVECTRCQKTLWNAS